jgi:hypothetical protein
MAHTFKYQTTGSSKFPRPFIPLTLRYKDRTVKIKALVDSGADFCMFDGELTYMLDIDVTKLEKININGVAGAATGYAAHIEIGVKDQFFPTLVVFSFDFSPDEFGGRMRPGNTGERLWTHTTNSFHHLSDISPA